jgi:hypothetical protein
MKKITCSFLVFIFIASVSLQAQINYIIHENTYQKVSISFTFENLKTTEVITEEGLFSRIYMDGCVSSTHAGEPELPVSVNMLEIPIFEDYVLHVQGKDFMVYDADALGINYPVYPAQPSISKSHKGPIEFIQNKNIYQTNDFYALPLARFEEVGIMRNVNLGTLYVSPVQYNPVTRQIKFYTTIEVEIVFNKADLVQTQTIKELHKSPLFRPSRVINAQKPSKAEFSNAPVKYLIVAHSMFRGALDEFITWKKRKGFLVEIGYTDEANVGATTASIAAFIKTHYTEATPENPAPTYVLLVGDVEQIPAFRGTTGSHPTDLYYFTWADGYLPCCYYGRFSAQNIAQLMPQIEKTLQYEQFTMPDPDYLNNIVLIAGYDEKYAPKHGNGFVNYVTEYYATHENGYKNIYPHYHPCSSEDAQIRAEIGAGVGIAHYTAHGNQFGWGDPSFYTIHIPAMCNENKYSLMIGNSCLSNKFDYDECFGEALLRTKGKGAVGYIGASNNTYWNEDYFWAIGCREFFSEHPIYAPASLGVYDRLFHTHEEIQEQWMVTFGAMVIAGNEAVQASYSFDKTYYWEIYHLMGDPSVMPYLTKPSSMEVVLPNELQMEDSLLYATVAPYSYCALTDSEQELLSAGFADEAGNITLHFDPIIPGEYEFSAYAQNYISFFQPIYVASEASYLTGTITLTNTSVPQNGAMINFNVQLKNFGNKNASNVQLILTTESNDVIIEYNKVTIPQFAAGEEKLFSCLFRTIIKNYVPDEIPLVFHLEVVSEHNSFHKTIKVVAQAPKLEIKNTKINNVSGTNFIEPGDEINIEFELSNIGHNTIFDVFAAISVYFSEVELFENKRMIDKIDAGESVSVSFRGKIGKYVEAGDIIPFYISAFKGTYATEGITAMTAGNLIEDFETGDFSRFDWKQGENPWEITTSNVYEGKFCAHSKTNLNHSSVSQLKISTSIPFASTVSYSRTISSEEGFDFFNFYVDNKLKENLSGTMGNWGVVIFEVEPGEHTFTFEYAKDMYISEGQDCAWIDNVSIPGMGKLITEDLPKIKVINHTIGAGLTNIKFDLKNTSFVNTNHVTGELSCNIPELLIFAEYSTDSQTLPFSIEKNGEISVNFELKPMLLRDLEREFVEFVFTVKSGKAIVYYPFILEINHLNSAFPAGTSMLVFPNPVHTILTIIAETPIESYQIIDIKGSVVNANQNINNYKAQINVTSLAAGIYFIKMMETSHRTSIQKFIKQ